MTIVVSDEKNGARKTQTFLMSIVMFKNLIILYRVADVTMRPGYIVPVKKYKKYITYKHYN